MHTGTTSRSSKRLSWWPPISRYSASRCWPYPTVARTPSIKTSITCDRHWARNFLTILRSTHTAHCSGGGSGYGKMSPDTILRRRIRSYMILLSISEEFNIFFSAYNIFILKLFIYLFIYKYNTLNVRRPL